jgi:hypothetical protein
MPSNRKTSKPKIQIDADWLLGPEPKPTRPPRSRALKSFMTLLMLGSVVGVVACYWEPWSQQILRWQWERWLASDQTDDDTIAALVSLGDLVDNSTVLLIQQLQATDPARRSVAFQVLKSHCDSPAFRRISNDRQQEIVAAIEQLNPTDPDGMMMRSWVAARVMARLGSSPSAKAEWRDRLSALLNTAGDTGQGQSLANTRSLLLRGSDKPQNAEAMVSKPAVPPLPGSPIPLQASTQVAGQDNRAMPFNELRDESKPESKRESPTGPPAASPREPTRIRIASDASVKTISAARTANLSDRNEVSVLIEAKRDRSVGELLQCLEDESDQEVAQIVEELQSKGFSEAHVELAMALARGTSKERLQALEALPQAPGIHHIAWLVWMAESRDPAARLKAIAMLGSTADADAIRHLQRIEQRESDPRIAAQIRQALIATGAAPSKTR